MHRLQDSAVEPEFLPIAVQALRQRQHAHQSQHQHLAATQHIPMMGDSNLGGGLLGGGGGMGGGGLNQRMMGGVAEIGGSNWAGGLGGQCHSCTCSISHCADLSSCHGILFSLSGCEWINWYPQ